ncbi:MAG: hypothetical protein SCALA702_23580 [Melioribacteraceae bacterium]|nr:MAG: hypothetical protein SCALA702_23580 [Melioribacteraceae bacterium]
MAHTYETNLKWEEGRKGNLSAPGLDSFDVATPPEFKGGIEGIWSPEHLFVASADVCLMTTFLAIAENSNLEFTSYSSSGIGKLDKVDGTVMIYEIELKPVIVVKFEKDIERAERIVNKAEHHCLVSNSMKTKIILSPEIVLEKN